MDEVRITRLTFLPFVSARGVHVRFIDELGIRRGVITTNLIENGCEWNHGRENFGRLRQCLRLRLPKDQRNTAIRH
jgi:hypothetical protein